MTTVLDSATEVTIPIRVLGPVTIVTEEGTAQLGGPKQRAVLAMLITKLGKVVTTDELVDGIWGEDPPPAVLSSIHTYVSNLRATVGRPLDRQGSGYRLEAPRADVDCYRFEDQVAAARVNLATNPSTASVNLRQALALWSGRAYSDVVRFPGLAIEATRLEESRLSAVEARIEADLALGKHGSLVGELDALAAEYPLRESLRAKHMLALYRDGRQADALRAYRRTQDYLREELGVHPSAELSELEERILNHDYSLIHSREVVSEQIALLFTDIVDSTLLWETNPTAMQAALSRHDHLVQSAVEANGGTVIKGLGDGFIAAFAEASLAAQAAMAAQQAILASDWSPVELRVRMVVDTGEVERRGGDLFGTAMNRGSRLLNAGHGGQILLSDDAQKALTRDAGTQVKSLGEHRFRGLGRPQAVHQLVADGLPASFPPLNTSGASIELDRSFGDSIRGYELRERVGRGAFATVYRGYQPAIGREVAIKIVKPEFANHPAFIRQFESEARFVASLEHPHIVSVYDYWRDADGAYVVGPFMVGRSLADATFATMPLAQVIKIASQVGSALSYAHRQGVVHRDVKPANILLDGDGNAYLSDFGIAARAVEEATGIQSKSIGYRAPEDRRGQAVDVRSDLYGLAAVVARLLLGVPPDHVDLSLVDERVRDVLARGLAGDPADRYESVDEFLEHLLSRAGGTAVALASIHRRNPYKGLAAFDQRDAPDFFGRSEEIGRLVHMVRQNRLSAVVGPSGSGKSSLTLAGLLPALDAGAVSGSESWVAVRAVPGGYPFDELATSLAAFSTQPLSELATELSAPDGKGLLRAAKRIGQELAGELVIVIDQYEELFTLVADEDVRNAFATTLVTAASDPVSRVRVVLTLRADFFHQVLGQPILGQIIGRAHLALAPLDADGIRLAIVEPAVRAGLQFEPGLPERIVADLRNQPGSLPLLQFTLDRLATKASEGLITDRHYMELGGVKGALAERAEAIFAGLTGSQKHAAQQVFTRLLLVSEEADDVRRRVRMTELESLGLPPDDLATLVEKFGKERLLTFDVDSVTRGATVEVAHEALLREWPTLRNWVDTRRESLILQRRFHAAFDEWEESGQHPSSLLTGGKLIQYQEWASGKDVTLTTAESEFLGRSIDQAASDARTRITLRRRIMVGFAVAAVIAIVLAVLAFIQRGAAERHAAIAEARELVLEADRAVATDPELSVLLSLEAIEAFRAAGEEPSPSAIGTMRRGINESVVSQRFPGGGFVAVSPDGAYLATRGGGASVAVWNLTTGKVVQELIRSDGSPIDARFASGDTLAVAYSGVPRALRVWEWRTGASVDLGGETPLPEGPAVASLLQIDRQLGLATVRHGSNSGFEVWDLNRQERRFIEDSSVPGIFLWPSFFPDGRLAFLDFPNDAIEGWIIRIVDSTTGEQSKTVVVDWGDHPEFIPGSISVSPDGSWAAIYDQEQIALVDLASGKALWVNDGLTRTASALWLPDGEHLFVGGEVAPSVLRARDGEAIRQLQGGARGGTYSHDLVPGTDQVAAAGVSSLETVIFDLAPVRSDLPTRGSQFRKLTHLGFVGNGDRLAVSDLESSAVIDAFTGEVIDRRPGAEPAWFAWGIPFFSRGGDYAAGPDAEGRSTAWSNLDQRVIYTAPDGWGVQGISSDGTLAVIVGGGQDWNETASQLIRTSDGSVVAELEVEGWSLQSVFSPDNKMVLTDLRPNLRIWDTSNGALLREIESNVIDVTSFTQAFTPDGSILVAGTQTGSILILDMEGLLAGLPTEEAVLRQIPAHTTFINQVLLSPDGSMILSRAQDEPVKLWDLDTGEKLGEFDTDGFRFGAFHPTEPLLYIALPDDRIGIYTLDTDQLIEIARSRLTRELTAEECQLYLRRSCALQ